MNVGTSESKGVDPYDASSDGNGPIDDANPTVSEGGDVRVRMEEVQVGGPDSSLQREQHLHVASNT